MTMKHVAFCLVWVMAITSWGFIPTVCAEADKSAENKAAAKDKGEESKPLDGKVEKAAVTHHKIIVDGEEIAYRATAANMPMKDENGKLKATVFFVAYEKETPQAQANESQPTDSDTATTQPACTEPESRPITFVFNGGPGAAAVWLHLGAVGPKRIALQEDGHVMPPPYYLEDNPWTWLDVSDLVFIDPVGTGFSRPAEGEKSEQFFGVQEDIAWVADFIRLYLTTYDRWLSPKFLAGESYGTTRAAGLSVYLLDRYGIALNGITLISSVLEFQAIQIGDGNDLPYPLYLPTYAATAWYHKKLPADLQNNLESTLKEVEQWALTNYMVVLAKGLSLSREERESAIAHLARYTSLDPAFIERCNLRVSPWVFEKELLRAKRELIGRFDSRITGYDPDPGSTWPAYDPSLSQYFAVYSSTFNDYVRRTLKYESVLPYEVLSNKVRPWPMGKPGEGYLTVLDDLQEAMVKNPNIRILFASGYYDLATPYFAATHAINRLDVGEPTRNHITHTFYEGGHMMYHHRASMAKLKGDVAAMIKSAVPSR